MGIIDTLKKLHGRTNYYKLKRDVGFKVSKEKKEEIRKDIKEKKREYYKSIKQLKKDYKKRPESSWEKELYQGDLSNIADLESDLAITERRYKYSSTPKSKKSKIRGLGALPAIRIKIRKKISSMPQTKKSYLMTSSSPFFKK